MGENEMEKLADMVIERMAKRGFFGGQPVKRTKASFAQKKEWTKRDLEVLACLGEGMSNKVIAEKLSLTVGTVKVYVSRLMSETGAENRSQLGLMAKEILGV